MTRNVVAKDLRTPKYRQRRVESKKKYNKKKKIFILVGPEGDFSDEEKEFIYDRKFLKVNLGNTILRTETSIISILSVLNELMTRYE